MNIFKNIKFLKLKSLFINKRITLFNNETNYGFYIRASDTKVGKRDYKINKKAMDSIDVECTVEDLNESNLTEKDLIDLDED